MKFIELTFCNGEKVLINANKILYIFSDHIKYTTVVLDAIVDNDFEFAECYNRIDFKVRETCEEIKKMLEEVEQ